MVDIRSVPYSRFCPQFNKTKIENTLLENNIRYIFGGDNLGGRINDPECYLNKQIPERKTNIAELINYDILKTRSWFIEGIHTLIKLTGQYIVAIMCSEEDPDRFYITSTNSSILS
ncbi:MAG: DUF488 domain-containing protein [Spirochaetales bacterium]|nr:DUF488 domain-containing protein [Spirochaetales bacterium]